MAGTAESSPAAEAMAPAADPAVWAMLVSSGVKAFLGLRVAKTE